MSLVLEECADRLDAARRGRQAMTRLTEAVPDLSVEDGYRIQSIGIERRLRAGERVVGAKLGLTSRAKQQQMRCVEPCYGVLTDVNLHPAVDPVRVDSLIHPRVEPEIVFVMRDDIGGPGVTGADVLAATRSVCCGLEVIDSRYADFSFTAADVIADNTSEALVVLGGRHVDPAGIDLALLGLVLEADGEIVTTATGAATMGHPADAVAMLANFLGARGEAIRAGWTIFTGGLTAAVPLRAGGWVTATFAHLGAVTVRGA